MRTKSSVRSEKPKSRFPGAPSRDAQQEEFKNFYNTHDVVFGYLLRILYDGFNRCFFTSTADLLHKDISTIYRRYTSEGVGFITCVLPKLFASLLGYLESGISTYEGWKLQKGTEYPAFLQQYFRKIYDAKTCEQDRVMYVDTVYQICVAFKKLKGPYRNSILRKQLADFVETDIELRYLQFKREADTRLILSKAREYTGVILHGLDPEFNSRDFLPRPGPGATNINREKNERFRPHVLYEQLNEQFPYEEWFYSHPWDLVTETWKHPFLLPKEERPTSRFKFVPKTFSKPRGICIEQLETQYLQQAIKHGLVKRLESHPITSGRINFSSQKVNGDLALEHSKTRHMATLDMSDASDRVSRELVSYLTQDNPVFREKLLALSTELIELPDEINFISQVPVAKFAPMGSALCFPVMALVHFVLIRAIMATHHFPATYLDSVYVYGDDIVIPSPAVEEVYKHLPAFGMKLNETKSFKNSFFRESCGKHAYYGCDITPVYFKSIPKLNMNFKELLSCVHQERQLFKKGFKETASFLRSQIRRWCLRNEKLGFLPDLPFVPPNSPILGFIRDEAKPLSCKELHSKRRWNSDLQCEEVRWPMLTVLQKALPSMLPDEGYLRFLTTGAPLESGVTAEQATSGHVKGFSIGFKTRWKWLSETAMGSSVEIDDCGFKSAFVRIPQWKRLKDVAAY